MASSPDPKILLSSGNYMPSLGLGTFNDLKQNGEVYKATKIALEVGYRMIDTAWYYLSEDQIGQAIAEKIKEGLIAREDVFVVTKLWNTFHDPEDVEPACRESLKALGVDYIDLYLIHCPVAFKKPECREGFYSKHDFQSVNIDFVDTWKAMEKLVELGLVRSIGVSNFNQQQLTRLLQSKDLKIKPANNQIEISPYFGNADLVDFCFRNGISVTGYCPLYRGGDQSFVDKESQPPLDLLSDPVLTVLARKYKKTPAQVALRWGIQRGFAIIPKSVSESRIKENFQIFDFSIDDADMKKISALDKNTRICAHPWWKSFPNYPF